MSVNALCTCGSKIKYKKCCKPYHEGKIAPNALILMKSRYSAYTMNEYKYIIKSTHENNPEWKKEKTVWQDEIIAFSKQTDFQNLEIIEFIDGADEAYVTFQATLFTQGNNSSFTEKSRFLKVDKKWYYEKGEFL